MIAGANIRSVRMTPGIDFFEELERAARVDSQAQDDDPGLSQQPDRAVRRPVVLRARGRAGQEHDILVVHDLAFTPTSVSTAMSRRPSCRCPARDVAVEFFTMSKSYNMAGWRIGYMVGNRELVGALARIKSYHDHGTSTPIQVASIGAGRPAGLRQRDRGAIPAPPRRAGAACTRQVGMWRSRRRPCISGRRSPIPGRAMVL